MLQLFRERKSYILTKLVGYFRFLLTLTSSTVQYSTVLLFKYLLFIFLALTKHRYCRFCKNLHSCCFKERLIPSSAWKDYSAVNTNYAFEPYEAEEKTPGSKASILPITKSQGQLSGNKIQSHAGNGLADTKSLQRLHGNGRFGNNPPERNTYSLPRTSHPPNTHHQGYYTHRPHSELQPDFYFMPSQRKYSGEVVRVYVDYNNVSKK